MILKIPAVGGTGNDYAGGAGGNGRIRIEYETSITGSTNPTASSSQNTIPELPAEVSGGSGSILSKGDLIREVKWLSGGTNVTTTYTYDSYGKVIGYKKIHIKDNYKKIMYKIYKNILKKNKIF